MYNRVISFLPSPSLLGRVPARSWATIRATLFCPYSPPRQLHRNPYKSGRHFAEMDFELPDYYSVRRKSLSASKYRVRTSEEAHSVWNLITRNLSYLLRRMPVVSRILFPRKKRLPLLRFLPSNLIKRFSSPTQLSASTILGILFDTSDLWFSLDVGLTEEEVVLAKTIAECPESEHTVQKAALVLRLREGIGSLARILKTIENFKGTVTHVETRPSKKEGLQFDVLVKIDMTRQCLLQLIRNLRQSSALDGVTLLGDNSVSIKDPWFPRHASELDNCNHLMTKYEPDLDMNHPGFADKEYRARRKVIAEIAFAYKYGDPIPNIPYTETENETWSRVFNTIVDLVPKHACVEYRRTFKKLQEEKIFESHRIPQLQEVSEFLKKNTGFTLRPAAGLLTARDFLSSLAFRVFQSTQYIRHIKTPYHTPEP